MTDVRLKTMRHEAGTGKYVLALLRDYVDKHDRWAQLYHGTTATKQEIDLAQAAANESGDLLWDVQRGFQVQRLNNGYT